MFTSLASVPFLGMIVDMDKLLPVLLTTVIFVAIGLVVFGIAFFIVVMVSPFSVKKEIEEDQNTALAIIIASVIIGESGHAREKRSRYKGSITVMPSLYSNGIWLISQVRKGKGASGFPPLPAQFRVLPA